APAPGSRGVLSENPLVARVKSDTVLYGALIATLGIAVAKFVAAGISASSAMLAQRFTPSTTLTISSRRPVSRRPRNPARAGTARLASTGYLPGGLSDRQGTNAGAGRGRCRLPRQADRSGRPARGNRGRYARGCCARRARTMPGGTEPGSLPHHGAARQTRSTVRQLS